MQATPVNSLGPDKVKGEKTQSNGSIKACVKGHMIVIFQGTCHQPARQKGKAHVLYSLILWKCGLHCLERVKIGHTLSARSPHSECSRNIFSRSPDYPTATFLDFYPTNCLKMSSVLTVSSRPVQKFYSSLTKLISYFTSLVVQLGQSEALL